MLQSSWRAVIYHIFWEIVLPLLLLLLQMMIMMLPVMAMKKLIMDGQSTRVLKIEPRGDIGNKYDYIHSMVRMYHYTDLCIHDITSSSHSTCKKNAS